MQLTPPVIICLGEALLDRLGPLGGDPLLDKPVEDCFGGAPANVACGLAKLGTSVAFVGRLGNDELGHAFQKLMQMREINLTGLQIDNKRPTRIVLVQRNHDGERSFQGFDGDLGNGFADEAISTKDLIDIWANLDKNVRWLLIGTIPLGSGSSSALLWSVEKALERGIKIALDVNWRPTFWDLNNSSDSAPNKNALSRINNLLKKVSLIKLAKEEAIWFFNSSNPLSISESLPNHPDVVVTDGGNALKWCIKGCAGEMPALSPSKVVDTTGAGDAFTAGLLHQLTMFSSMNLDHETIPELMRFAAACGALVCGGAGGIAPQPTQKDVEEFLSNC